MTKSMKSDKYGTFGNLSKTYDDVRPEMPEEVLATLLSHLDAQKHTIIDLGCGTGIITRQLSARGFMVTGTDIDKRMIEQAENHQNDGHINYVVAPTEKLPFPDSSFDAATAFSAFHWFANEQALDEIKRVLKEKGVFFVANRNQIGEMRREYLDILRSFIDEPIPSAKKNYKPADILESCGFVNVAENIIPIVEEMSIERSISYVQSTSLWNLVPIIKQQEALHSLREFFNRKSKNGTVERPIEIQTVVAWKD